MRNIVFDTDPGIDDAFAILLALAAKDEINVEAICTVNGNSPLDKVTNNALRILELAGREDIPVYAGCSKPLERENINEPGFHGEDGLGNSNLPAPHKKTEEMHAVDFLIQQARKEKGEFTILPIGPLTNIAKCVQQDKEFVNNVKELIIMGGAEFDGNRTPYAEFNFWKDPEAAELVLHAGFKKITLVGLEATACVDLNPALREMLHLINTPFSNELHHMTRIYADNYWNAAKKLGCELCDVLTTAHVLDPSICELVPVNASIVLDGEKVGRSEVKRIAEHPELEANCYIATKADKYKFFKLFFGKLFPDYKDYIVENNLI